MPDIQTLLEQRTQAWNRRDPVALAAGYADEAVVTSPTVRVTMAAAQSDRRTWRPDWQARRLAPAVYAKSAAMARRLRAAATASPT